MSIEELRDKLSQNMKGTNVSILSQSEIASTKEWIKTPAYDLNRILSGSLFKGLPNKTFTIFIGPEASGKSSLMCLSLVKAQEMGYIPVVIDTEGAWDMEFCRRWGLDIDNMLYTYTPWIEEIFVFLSNLIDSGQQKVALVIDSIGGLENLKLLTDSLTGEAKADQGTLQKKIKRMLKMVLNIAKGKESIAMASGHYYGSPSRFGSAEEIGGGKFVKLAPDIIVSLKKSPIYENPTAKKIADKGEIFGSDITAITLKNRYYPPFNECKIEVDYQKGVNSLAGLTDIALKQGIIKQGGSWFTFGDLKLQGMPNLMNAINNNDIVTKKLLKDVETFIQTTGYSTKNIEMETIMKEKETEEGPIDVIEPEVMEPIVEKAPVKKKTVKKVKK